MKKVILALAVVTFFAACNSGEATETPKTDSPAAAAAAAVDTMAAKVDTMAAKVDTMAAKIDTAVKK